MMEPPKGMSVRIEQVGPVLGDPFRQCEIDRRRLIIECRWRDTVNLGLAARGCAASWVMAVLAFFGGVPLGFVFLVVTSVISYFTAAAIWNTSVITIDAVRLRVRHGPIPVRRSREIRREDLSAVAWKTNVPDDDSGAVVLVAHLRSGEQIRIMTPGPENDYEQCSFAAEQISRFLQETPMPGLQG